MSGPNFKFVLPPEANADLTPDYRKFVEKAINDAMAKRYEMVEVLMLAYMAGTGFRPDQLELCEQQCSDAEGIKMKWFIRPLPNAKVTEEGKADPCHVLFAPS